MTWDGVEGGRCAALAAVVGESSIRTAFHVLQLHPGSGIYLDSYRHAYIDEVSTEWRVEQRGEYVRFKAGSRSDDWATLSVSPSPRRTPVYYDPDLPLRVGDKVYIAGYDGVRFSSSGVINVSTELVFRTGRVISPVPSERPLDSQPERLVFIEVEPPGLSRGWSGAPVFAADSTGGVRMVGTVIGGGVRGERRQGKQSNHGEQDDFAIFVR
ncbi:MAG: trypsin-like peptidase domain-containing protein [Phycisphaerae bacterium]